MVTFKEIARLFEEMELRLVASLKRNLARHKKEEQDEGFQWSAWQAEKLKNLERFRRGNRQVMNDYTDVIDSDTRELMAEQFEEGKRLADEEAEGLNALSRVSDEHFFGVNSDKMEHLISDITILEKKTETAALRMMDDVYRQTLNRVQLEMAAGAMTLEQAVDMAVKDFLAQGISCIVYRDGKHVNIADYVRMALRTTSTRATLQGKAARYAEMGYDTVLVSQYGMCSKTCLPWQGRVYIDDVFTEWDGERDGDHGISKYCGKRFPLLSSAIRGGLFHPNCRHTISLWIEGRSKLPEPLDPKEIQERAKAEQKQRALEREVRRRKREVLGLSEPNAVKEAKRRLKEAQKKLKDHVDAHDYLRRDYNREKVCDGAAADKQLNVSGTLPNVQVEGHTAEVEIPAPKLNYPPDSKTYIEEKIPQKKTPGYTDVTEEYERNATPGKGEILVDKGYDTKKHQEERSFADWLYHKFGGVIEIKDEKPGSDNVSNPDYIWNKKLWDLKTVSTEKSANSALRKGIKQITDRRKAALYPPGGVMLDYGDNNISVDVLLEVIEKRMAWHEDSTIDIMIVQKREVLMILRYKKRSSPTKNSGGPLAEGV